MVHILLDGLPGIGKTTLVKNIVKKLQTLGKECDGFYTEEVKIGRGRIGFDIVTLGNQRGILARKVSEAEPSHQKLPKVGQYVVYLNDFEKLCLPVFENPKQILIIDEIGKMELYSKKFQEAVKKIFSTNITILATVPLKGVPYIVKELKNDSRNILFTVNQNNRDVLVDEIIQLINK